MTQHIQKALRHSIQTGIVTAINQNSVQYKDARGQIAKAFYNNSLGIVSAPLNVGDVVISGSVGGDVDHRIVLNFIPKTPPKSVTVQFDGNSLTLDNSGMSITCGNVGSSINVNGKPLIDYINNHTHNTPNGMSDKPLQPFGG